MADPDYSAWSAEQLVTRVQRLEQDLRKANERIQNRRTGILNLEHNKATNSVKTFDSSRYSTRKIALKFAYLGQKYNGLEYTPGNTTPLPTIEEALWAALMKGRLIFPTDEEAIAAGQVTWEGCDYTKCGRTDKGVSAFGQVVGLKVRSNRPLPGSGMRKKMPARASNAEAGAGAAEQTTPEDVEATEEPEVPFDSIKDELPYVHILNRLLPPDIRALAWCGDLPDDFSARFSCRERRYRYFFTNPAFNPTFGKAGLDCGLTTDPTTGSTRREGWLDIPAMQDAAKRYEGLHDFRNLCKIDASKQLTDFRRRIYHSEVRELDPSQEPAAYIAGQAFSEFSPTHSTNDTRINTSPAPKVYQFILHGSAFLWHQVRQMVAILFLVGQGHEHPSIVDTLMNPTLCPTRPHYEMADDAPLVLWDCIFPDLDSENHNDSLPWIWAGDEVGSEGRAGYGKYGSFGLVDGLWEVWRQRKIDEVLAGSLLNLAVSQGRNEDVAKARKPLVYQGGDAACQKGAYVPLMKRERLLGFEVVNARYAEKRGWTPKSEEELQALRDSRRDPRHDHLVRDGEA